jgi:hypothetical protein
MERIMGGVAGPASGGAGVRGRAGSGGEQRSFGPRLEEPSAASSRSPKPITRKLLLDLDS